LPSNTNHPSDDAYDPDRSQYRVRRVGQGAIAGATEGDSGIDGHRDYRRGDNDQIPPGVPVQDYPSPDGQRDEDPVEVLPGELDRTNAVTVRGKIERQL
jgi:hypothetical protein